MNWITNAVLPKIKALVSTNDVPDNLWIKCKSCGQMIFHREFEQAHNSCSTCGHHAPLPPEARFAMTFDDCKFDIIPLTPVNDDPLKFRDSRRYAKRQMTWIRNNFNAQITLEKKYSESLYEKIFALIC